MTTNHKKVKHLSSSEYGRVRKLKGFNPCEWEWNKTTHLYDRIPSSEELEKLYLGKEFKAKKPIQYSTASGGGVAQINGFVKEILPLPTGTSGIGIEDELSNIYYIDLNNFLNNNKLKSEIMSTTETKEKKEKKAPVASSTEKVAKVKKSTAKAEKKAPVKKEKVAKAKKEKVAKAPKEKKVGVIASILEFIQAGPVKEGDIVKKLTKRFPDKTESSMKNTVRAQIGSSKRPLRMEKEKNVTFVIEINDKTKEKTFSIK